MGWLNVALKIMTSGMNIWIKEDNLFRILKKLSAMTTNQH